MEIINHQLLQRKNSKIQTIHWSLIIFCIIITLTFISLIILDSPYLEWDYSDIKITTIGIFCHGFEWLFIRVAPIVVLLSLVGIYITRKRI